MPRRRLTYEQAELSGSSGVNPGRFADRKHAPKTEGSVGNAPKYFDAATKKVWKEIATSIPPGIAGSADRQVIEMASRLMHQFRTDPNMQASKIAILMQLLSRLGLDPQARTRIQVEPPKQPTEQQDVDDEWTRIQRASERVRTARLQ